MSMKTKMQELNKQADDYIRLELAKKTPKERENIHDTGNFLMGIAVAIVIMLLIMGMCFAGLELTGQELHITSKGASCIDINDTYINPYMHNYSALTGRSDKYA